MTLDPTTRAVLALIRDNGYAVSVRPVPERECPTTTYDVTAVGQDGERFVGSRDIAVNSYVAAGQTDVPLNRTPVAPRRMAPAYRFIPFIAVIFYVLAGLLMFSAVLLLVFVVVSL